MRLCANFYAFFNSIAKLVIKGLRKIESEFQGIVKIVVSKKCLHSYGLVRSIVRS